MDFNVCRDTAECGGLLGLGVGICTVALAFLGGAFSTVAFAVGLAIVVPAGAVVALWVAELLSHRHRCHEGPSAGTSRRRRPSWAPRGTPSTDLRGS